MSTAETAVVFDCGSGTKAEWLIPFVDKRTWWEVIRAVAKVCEGRFFQKTQKLLKKFPGLATSGRHNSAIITNAENSRSSSPPTGCLVSILPLESYQYCLFPGVYAAH